MFRFPGLSRFSQSRNSQHSRKHLAHYRTSPQAAVQVECLEERLVLSEGLVAVGSDLLSQPRVAVFDGASGTFLYEFNPYNDVPGFIGGVRTAVGYIQDINTFAIVPVIITAPGPGLFLNAQQAGPVRVFAGVAATIRGIANQPAQNVAAGQFLTSLNPFPGFGGGIFVGAADFNLDGFHEVIMGADEGGGPHVRINSLSPFAPFQSFFNQFVYAAGFRGGVRVAAGNVNADAIPDLIVGAGPGGGPHVRVLTVPGNAEIASFFAYSPNFVGGVYVAGGDFTGDARAEVVTGAGPGGGPHVRIIPLLGGTDPNDPSFDLNFFSNPFPFAITYTGGVRVAAAYVNNDNIADLIVSAGFATGTGLGTSGNLLRVFNGASGFLIVTPQGNLYEGAVFINPPLTGTGGSFPSSGKFLFEALSIDTTEAPALGPIAPIDSDEVQALVDAALLRLQEAGVPAAVIDHLNTLEIQVAPLNGNLLGLARPGLVVLDDDAAGFGWFIDPTPLEDEEFGSNGQAIDPAAIGKVDLLTVILHELGHELGLPDLDVSEFPHHLMTGTLPTGERRLPGSALEALFSGDSLWDHLMAPTIF